MNWGVRFPVCRAVAGMFAASMLAGCSSGSHIREIDPQADEILTQMCAKLDSANSLHLRVSATMDRPVENGQLAEFHRTSDVTIARPDKLFSKTDSDDGKWTAWYRDKSLTVLDRDSNSYAVETVPACIDKMLDYMAEKHDLTMPMADLLVGETHKSLIKDVETGEYLGIHAVGDTPCHHLLFKQKNIDWQIWIDAGAQPLPRKMVITYKLEPDQPQYVATIDDWNLTPTVMESTFQFTPPTNAKSVPMSDLIDGK